MTTKTTYICHHSWYREQDGKWGAYWLPEGSPALEQGSPCRPQPAERCTVTARAVKPGARRTFSAPAPSLSAPMSKIAR